MKVLQVLPTLGFGDAIGNHTIALNKILEKNGYETGIYAEIIDNKLPKDTAKPVNCIPELTEKDVVIYHLSTGTSLNEAVGNWTCKKIIEYHNITPSNFFASYSWSAKQNCEDGLRQTAELANKADYCLADSQYNKHELKRMGYACEIDVLPIVIPFSDYEKKPSNKILDKFNDGKKNIIFTGRIAPNKKQEDVIKAFYYYKKINPESRLIIVGNYIGMERYFEKLQKYVDALDLEDVIFTGQVHFDEILAYYKIANLFLCMSEHEGFCVPLIEAMFFNIPILAYGVTAIPETLGEGGVLLDKKDAKLAAEWIHRIISDVELRECILSAQQKRLADFQYETIVKLFEKYLERFLGVEE